MSVTPNNGLPLLPENTLLQYLIFNELALRLDALLQLSVLDRGLNTPPGSPADGDRYIVGASPTGAWVGKASQVAVWVAADAAWTFLVPVAGWQAYVIDESSQYAFNGTAWALASGGAADRSTVTALSISSGVVNIDCSLGDYFTLALTANVTSITFSNLPAAGKGASLAIQIQQDGTGGRTVALPASFKATGGSDVAVQAAANARTLLTITSFDQGTRWEYAMQEIAA
jgi:hypothetical protein